MWLGKSSGEYWGGPPGIPSFNLTMVISGRILSEWQGSIKEMEMSTSHSSPSDPVTPQEYCHVALTVVVAISNPHGYFSIFSDSKPELWPWVVLGVMEWDVTQLFDQIKNRHPTTDADPGEDHDFQKYFPNLRLGSQDEPCIVKDIHGHILLWYLPYIYSQH